LRFAQSEKNGSNMITMHPGEYLTAAYLQPMDLSHTDLAKALDVSVSTVSRIVNKKADVTPSMAIRLSHVLGRSPESWISMQSSYSLSEVENLVDISKLKSFSR
jgi:addiction module HigA family antidote